MQGDAGILVEIGPADRGEEGDARDEVFADGWTYVDAREPAQVFLLRVRAAVDERELRKRQRARRVIERPAIGAEDRAALRVALEVAVRTVSGPSASMFVCSARTPVTTLSRFSRNCRSARIYAAETELVRDLRVVHLGAIGGVEVLGEVSRDC